MDEPLKILRTAAGRWCTAWCMTCLLSPVDLHAQVYIMAPDAVWHTCTGTFHDSGGPNGSYGNNEQMVAVICPQAGPNTGGATVVQFTSFQVGSLLDPADQLVVHDGMSTTSPVLGTGSYGNSLAGQTFTASGPSGCLTFHWTSNFLGTAAGWSANIISGPDAGNNSSLTLCSDQIPFLLFDALGGDPMVGGTWSGPNGTHGPWYDPGTDPGGTYTYTVIDGGLCRDSASVMITNVPAPDPGMDTTLLMCISGPTVQLIDHLGGAPSPGGTWTGPNGATDGSFDPASSTPGAYHYQVGGNAPCANATATIVVAVTDMADAGISGSMAVCDSVSTLALFPLLGGTPDPGGTWHDPQLTGALNGDVLAPVQLGPGVHVFHYVVSVAGCGTDSAQV
jgi:hypothetical protein